MKKLDPRSGLYAIGLAVLLLGLTSSFTILYINEAPSNSPSSSESSDQGTPEDLKTGRRQMEVIGGKANIVASDFGRWFVSLFHGTRLALTIGFVTLFICAGIFWTADRLA